MILVDCVATDALDLKVCGETSEHSQLNVNGVFYREALSAPNIQAIFPIGSSWIHYFTNRLATVHARNGKLLAVRLSGGHSATTFSGWS
jgi:hypothetical protein